VSENSGKDGEMRFGIVIAGASIRENGLDYTRHTVTNQPDLGLDYSLQGNAETLASFCEVGVGKALPSVRRTLGDPQKRIEARVDVKTTESKLTGVTVDKFVSDVKKHPNTELHILVGGSGLTKSAEQKFESHRDALSEAGKAIVYVANEGAARLANEYKPEIFGALGGPLGVDKDDSSEDQGV